MADWVDVHTVWLAAIEAGTALGSDRDRISEHTADVVETTLLRPAGLLGALSRFGTRLGSDGWTLEEVSEWIEILSGLCSSPCSDQLRSFECGVALARGWTEGHLHGFRSDECFDAVTGLCTPAVLRLRLQQVFEQCHALGLAAGAVHRLVIIDADVNLVSALEADAVMVILADVVQRVFTSGETIARDANRIFVLVAQSEQLHATVTSLVEQSQQRSLLFAARILAWIEELPVASAHIERYIADIAA